MDNTTTTPTIGLIGFSPISRYDTMAPGEYNPRLQGLQAVATYDRMRRSDGQVNAVELLTTLPVCALSWQIEPGGKGRADREAAELIQRNLLGGESFMWEQVLRQALLSVMYGFSAHELVWSVSGRYVWLDNLFHLPATSVKEFHYDQGKLASIQQEGVTYAGSFERVDIPGDKLLVTTYRPEGGNLAGFPLTRPMYKHWYCKDSAYTILGMAIERLIMGVTIAQVGPGMSPEQRKLLLTTLENLRIQDKMGMVIDSDVSIEMLEAKRDLGVVLDYINHHDVMMARTALVQFINLGSSETGAYSVSEDHSKLFMIAEQSLADQIAALINNVVIPRMVAYNWPGLTVYPQLIHSHIRSVLKVEPLLEALSHMVAGALITPDGDLEDHIRTMLDLPPLSATAPATAPPPAADDDKAAGSRQAANPPGCCSHEADALQFAEVAEVGTLLEQINDQFQREAGEILGGMITRLQTVATKSLTQIEGPFERARVYPLLSNLALTGQDKYTRALRDYLTALAQAGRDAAAAVTGRPAPAPTAAERTHLNAQSQLLSDRHCSELRAAFIQQVLSGALGNVGVEQAVADAAQAARDRVSGEYAMWFREVTVTLTNHLSEQISSYLRDGLQVDPEGTEKDMT
jgi:hypothetical protein